MAGQLKNNLHVMRHVVAQCAYLSATNSRLRTSYPAKASSKKKKRTNQGHLRTACQLLFLLAALSSMCAVEAHISTTSSSSGTQGISNYVLAAKICTVTTARPSCFSLSFRNNRGSAQSLEKLNPLWSFSATTWALEGGKIRTNPHPASNKKKRKRKKE